MLDTKRSNRITSYQKINPGQLKISSKIHMHTLKNLFDNHPYCTEWCPVTGGQKEGKLYTNTEGYHSKEDKKGKGTYKDLKISKVRIFSCCNDHTHIIHKIMKV